MIALAYDLKNVYWLRQLQCVPEIVFGALVCRRVLATKNSNLRRRKALIVKRAPLH
jgi:hypothetical protein